MGSVGFDRIMELPGKFADWIMPDKIDQLNVSFTVKSLRVEFGGTGGNCAYTLGLLGKKPILVGFLGTDGLEYKEHLKAAGVDVSLLKIDTRLLSACGHVMTDKSHNQIWSYFPGPLLKMKEVRLKIVVDAENDFAALMPSEPEVFKKHLRELVKIKAHFMFDPAFFIPNLTKAELLMGIKNAEIIIGNEYEIALMEKKVNQVISDQLNSNQMLIRTLGENGSEIVSNGEVIKIPAVKVKKAVDPTGAGDAYRAGFLAGYIDGKTLSECGRMGAVAGAYCVENIGTQGHGFTLNQFNRRLYGETGKS